MKLSYRKKRYILYSLITLIAICIPFININGNQIFLLSFDHKELHLMGIAFNVQELYLMPFLLIMLFIGIFFMTTLGGRIWCGWSCPQTIFRVIYRDLIETKLLKLRKKISNKQQKPTYDTKNVIKKIIAITLFSCIALIASAVFLFYFVPPKEFFAYLSQPLEHKVLLTFWLCIAGFLVFDITFMAENFCIYVCPYARVQSVLYDNDTIMAIYDNGRGGLVYDNAGNLLAPPQKQDKNNECINCHQCVKVCPTHIDIRKGMQLECINCLECVDACTDVMGKLQKPTLVNWSSPNAIQTKTKIKYLRSKTIGYMVVLAIIFGIMLVMGSKKEPVLVNIDRNTQLYEIRKNGAIDNFYVFLFENTDKKDHRYSFEILNQEGIEIIRPHHPIKVESKGKIKEVVILRAKNLAVNNAKNDALLPLKIRIYAIDDSTISIERKSIFVYPKEQVLQKALHSKK